MSKNTLSYLKAQERDARRRLILNAARELFAKKNFRNVTVREIAKSAGVSIGTIYYYYDNLGELFLDIFFKSAESVTFWLDQELKNEIPSIKHICSAYIEFMYENMTFFQMMSNFMLGGEMSPEETEKLNGIMRMFMDRLETVIKTANPKADSRMAAHALFSSLNGIMLSYCRYPGRDQTEILKYSQRLAELVGDALGAYSNY